MGSDEPHPATHHRHPERSRGISDLSFGTLTLPPGAKHTLQDTPRIVAVIPARLASTRLPRKVLLPIAGAPMLAWVYRAARKCDRLSDVIVATDSEEVRALAEREGWPCIMTAPTLASGTDRVHAISQIIDADIYVNIQGDEPLLRPEHLDALLAPFANPAVQVTTLSTPCTPEQFASPHAVKVVAAPDGRALYFSRAAIPCDRDGSGLVPPRKHLGLYAYRRQALETFAALPVSTLEQTERLEQLRFLENGIDICVAPTPFDTIGVDTPADLLAAEAILSKRSA